MTYNDLVTLLLESTPEDWLRSDVIYTFKRDLNVTIRQREQDEQQPFDAAWATRFPDARAYTYVYELWYGASFVEPYFFASVDGGRAQLPYPKSSTELTITRLEYSIAQAVNSPERFHHYIDRFTVAG